MHVCEASKVTENSNLFGSPLDSRKISSFLEKSLLWLEKWGLKTEGIFRVSAGASIIESFANQYGTKKEFQESDFDTWQDNPHVIATVLKKYLRELPAPILTFDNYEMLIVALEREKDQIKKITDIIYHLPRGNYQTLKRILLFLRKIQEQSEFNKMTTNNLAIIFSPSLMRPPYELKDTFVMLRHSTLATDLVSNLISNFDEIFTKDIDQPKILPQNHNSELSKLKSNYTVSVPNFHDRFETDFKNLLNDPHPTASFSSRFGNEI